MAMALVDDLSLPLRLGLPLFLFCDVPCRPCHLAVQRCVGVGFEEQHLRLMF